MHIYPSVYDLWQNTLVFSVEPNPDSLLNLPHTWGIKTRVQSECVSINSAVVQVPFVTSQGAMNVGPLKAFFSINPFKRGRDSRGFEGILPSMLLSFKCFTALRKHQCRNFSSSPELCWTAARFGTHLGKSVPAKPIPLNQPSTSIREKVPSPETSSCVMSAAQSRICPGN